MNKKTNALQSWYRTAAAVAHIALLSLWVSNNGVKVVKARCSVWLSLDLLNPPSNSWTSIASGINRCFGEVRSFEAFKQLHLELISEAKRKSLPAIATVAGLDNAQSLQGFE